MRLHYNNLLTKPIGQGLGAFTLFVTLILTAQLARITGLFPTADWSYFLFGGMSLLLYAILNSLTFLNIQSNDSYFNKSLPVFVSLALVIIIICKLFSGFWLNQMGYYQWIYTVVAISYLLFIVIMRAIRGVMNIAQREDEKYQASLNKALNDPSEEK